MITPDDTTRILMRIEHAMGICTEIAEAAGSFMQILESEIPHIGWVGIYWLQGKELTLGPYAGPPTDMKVIDIEDGLCGMAVAEGTNLIVQDVSKRDDYIPRRESAQSEIVVLIRDTFGGVLGEIDADSDEPGAFDHTDEMLLESVATRLAAFVRRHGGTEREADGPEDD